MPVTLHPVDRDAWEADAQARTDLARIYADAPAERLPAPADAFIEGHLTAGGAFLCARFNDRLIGAVALRDDGKAWWLSHFCVRKPTRRRGSARACWRWSARPPAPRRSHCAQSLPSCRWPTS